jgi:hypothetical protein
MTTFPDICAYPAKLQVEATTAVPVAMAPIQQGAPGTVTITPPSNVSFTFEDSGAFTWGTRAALVTAADFNAAATTAAMAWAEARPPLPATGNVAAGSTWTSGGEMWRVIQTFNRTTFPDPPATYPALIRLLRAPWRLYAWTQPIDQYDAWKTVNPLTSAADECLHNGHRWRVAQGDGGGNNVWEPGVFGWTDLGVYP